MGCFRAAGQLWRSKGPTSTLSWVFGHSDQTDSAKAAFKLKVRIVCAAKGQNLSFNPSSSSWPKRSTEVDSG